MTTYVEATAELVKDDLRKIRKQKGFVGHVIDCQKNNEPTLNYVLTVFVEKKLPEAQLKREGRKMIPKDIHGVQTDIVEMEMPEAHDDFYRYGSSTRRDKSRPVYPGCSVSNIKGTAGTHGEFFRDRPFEGKFYGGLNAHVGFERVDMDISEQDRTIVKPGPTDGGNLLDKIGDLTTGTKINLNKGSNTRDSCLFEYDNIEDVNPDVPGYGVVEGVSVIAIGEEGLKPPCRSLPERTAKKLYENAAIRTKYTGGIGTIKGCSVWEPMSTGGSSGSSVRTLDGRFVTDTIFAGSSTHTITIPFDQNWSVYGKELVTKDWWLEYTGGGNDEDPGDDGPDDDPGDDYGDMPKITLDKGVMGVGVSLIIAGGYLIGKGAIPLGIALILVGVLLILIASSIKKDGGN